MWNASLHSNLNFPAPLSVLGFLAAGGGLILLLLAILVACFVRKPKIAALLVKLAAAATVVYFAVLFGFSLSSREVALARGQEKYFCEIDCHLAYAVVGTKTVPRGTNVEYIVSLRTRFDEATISNHRPKDAPLLPSPRTVLVVDGRGSGYVPGSFYGSSLVSAVIPGQSYITELHFDLPSKAKDLRLLVSTTPGWPDRLLIGDENSWLHKKTYFRL